MPRPSTSQKGRRPRRIGPVLKPVKAADRLNPQVFRALLHELVTERFGRDVILAAETINAARPPAGRKGHFRSEFRAETLYDLINDRARIKYYQLEAVAHLYRIPVSMLLLFTRVRSELEDPRDGFARAIDLLKGSRAFINSLERLLEQRRDEAGRGERSEDTANILNFSAFEELAKVFISDFENPQRSFPFVASVDESTPNLVNR